MQLRYRHQVAAAGVSVAALALVLGACSSSSSSSSPASSGSGSAAAGSSSSSSSLSGTINASGSTFQLTFQQAAISAFKSSQPGITVNYAGGGAREGRARLGGGAPHLPGPASPHPR